MKRIKEEALNLDRVQIMRNVRSDLASRVQQYWVNKPKSNIGLQYLHLRMEDGLIDATTRLFERTDILWLIVDGACNVFIEPDGYTQIDRYHGVEFSESEIKEIEQLAADVFARERVYVQHERKFLEERPWLQVHGMTPEQAVAKFAELGWGPTKEEK